MVEVLTGWKDVVNAARATRGKLPIDREPSDVFKVKMVYSEHSPLRLLTYRYTFRGIKTWVSTHLVRHKIGIEHFVRSQRTLSDRDERPQGALVDHTIIINAQSAINISKERLCKKAAPETRDTWIEFLNELYKVDEIVCRACVRKCVYRGFCPEGKSCGYCDGNDFHVSRDLYILGCRISAI